MICTEIKFKRARTSPLTKYKNLASEAIECPALPLEGVDDIHGSDSLPLGVLRVGYGVTDDILQEDLKNTPGLLINEARDPLDASSPGQATDGWLRDALDVVPENLPVPLGSSLAKPLASFTSS